MIEDYMSFMELKTIAVHGEKWFSFCARISDFLAIYIRMQFEGKNV